MGQSLSAKLVYGIATREEESLWEDDFGDGDEEDGDMEWAERIARMRGAVPIPWGECPETPYLPLEGYEAYRKRGAATLATFCADPRIAAIEKLWDEAVDAVEAEFPHIEITYGGVGDYRIPVIAIKDSGFTTYDAVSSVSLTVLPPAGRHAWDVELFAFAEAAGIDLDRKTWDDKPTFEGPRWFLVNNYG